jgi:prepilin-type N-terminal cleavage/methylation domain-containing protein
MLRTFERQKTLDSRGFTLVEVIVSMAITVIVMAAVFGLLTRGQRSFEREPQIADLQQSARTALDMVSRDVLGAGSGLPPEFPSFTPTSVDAQVGDHNPDVVEIIGASQSAGQMPFDPIPIRDFDGTVGTLDVSGTSLQVDDMVLVYNDVPTNADWSLRWIADVQQDAAVATLIFSETNSAGVTIPEVYSRFPPGADPTAVRVIARVSVVRYFAELVEEDLILRRQVDFGNAMPVGMIDDFQVAYMVGTQPPVENNNPPHPQPDAVVAITPDDIISGVRVMVTARSASENLEGAETGTSGDYIRRSFSSNISPRNILGGLAERTRGLGAN